MSAEQWKPEWMEFTPEPRPYRLPGLNDRSYISNTDPKVKSLVMNSTITRENSLKKGQEITLELTQQPTLEPPETQQS